MSVEHSNCWFKDLFGFEESYPNLKDHIDFPSPNILRSKANNRTFPLGAFSTPSLHQLRQIVLLKDSTFSYEHIVVDSIRELHSSKPGAVFQAASQFNCLEFPHYDVTPETGITDYITDHTQGPACAVACAAGTLYRNFFAPVLKDGLVVQEGQSENTQVESLKVL